MILRDLYLKHIIRADIGIKVKSHCLHILPHAFGGKREHVRVRVQHHAPRAGFHVILVQDGGVGTLVQHVQPDAVVHVDVLVGRWQFFQFQWNG